MASNLRQLRERRGFSFRDLARVSGVSLGTVTRVEKGEDTSVSVLAQLAQALDVSVAQILGDVKNTKPREITFYEALSVVQDRFAKLRRGEIDDDVLDEKALLAYIAEKSAKGE